MIPIAFLPIIELALRLAILLIESEPMEVRRAKSLELWNAWQRFRGLLPVEVAKTIQEGMAVDP